MLQDVGGGRGVVAMMQEPLGAQVDDDVAHVALIRRGRPYVGRCPFHDDTVPSLRVNDESSTFFCFGCKSGDYGRGGECEHEAAR